MIAAAAAHDPYLAVGWLCAGLAFQQLTDSVYWAATTSVSGRYASAGCGLMNTGGNVVGGVNALLVPLMARFLGWPAAVGTAAASALTAAILWLWIEADRRPLERVTATVPISTP